MTHSLIVRPLWLTLRGASPHVAFGWLLWLAVAAAGARLASAALGPAGPVLLLLTVGWLLARRLPVPLEGFRTYHLDDEELTVMEPWGRVSRLAWDAVTTVVEERTTLGLVGGGVHAALPLGPLVRSEALYAVLEHVVPDLAADLWERLEDGLVRCVPNAEPRTRSLAWWAWGPALLACVAAGGIAGLAVIVVLGAAERAVALARVRARSVTIHPAGVSLPRGAGGLFVPWAHAVVVPSADGLRIGLAGHGSGIVAADAPNFWAATAVIQLRAQIGSDLPVRVHFRVRIEGGGLAVVGEIEAAN